MQITDIKIRKTFNDDGPMKAVVSVTFDHQLALHDVKVINTKGKYFIVCTKPGIGVVTLSYIAGGTELGGGMVTGGKLIEKEFVIVARENNDNGGWL